MIIHFIKYGVCFVLFIFVFLINVNGQIPPVYLKHYNNEYAINPAVTGRDYYPIVNISHKQYWVGQAGSPSSSSIGGVFRMGTFNFYTPKMLLNKSKLLSKSRMGFGGFLIREKDGPLNNINASVSYAYFVPLSDGDYQLSFGLAAKVSYYSIDQSQLAPLEPGDIELNNLNEDNKIVPDADFGLYFHTDQFYSGLSLNDLFVSQTTLFNYTNKRDAFVHSGYKFYLKRFELEPMVLIGKINSLPLYYYSSLKLYYHNYNWFSLAFRSTKTLFFSFGVKVRRMQIVYSYEMSASKMIKYFDGAHELMIGMNIGLYEAQGLRKLVH